MNKRKQAYQELASTFLRENLGPEYAFNRRFDYEYLESLGAMLVFDRRDAAYLAAKNNLRHAQFEPGHAHVFVIGSQKNGRYFGKIEVAPSNMEDFTTFTQEYGKRNECQGDLIIQLIRPADLEEIRGKEFDIVLEQSTGGFVVKDPTKGGFTLQTESQKPPTKVH